MKNQVNTVKGFVQSDFGTEEEGQFLSTVVKSFHYRKATDSYADKLANDYGVPRSSTSNYTLSNKNEAFAQKNRRLVWIIISGAILLLISFFAYNSLVPNVSEQQYFASSEQIYIDMGGNSRGEVTQTELSIIALRNAYHENNLSAVVTEYDKIANKTMLNREEEIMAAVALASEQKITEAESIFNSILNGPETMNSFHQEVRWSMINMYILNQNIDQAKLIFESMSVGDYKYEETKKLLQ